MKDLQVVSSLLGEAWTVANVIESGEQSIFPPLRLQKCNRRTQGGKGVDWPRKEVDASEVFKPVGLDSHVDLL